MKKIVKPDPGTPEAREQGCTCPHEQPYWNIFPWIEGGRAWWIEQGCPVHGKKITEAKE